MARQESDKDPLRLPVQYVKGVGPARARQLARLGISTVADLLFHIPRRYEDRSNLTLIWNLAHGKVETTQGTVVSVGDLRPRHGLTITKAAIVDQTGVAYAVWYNQPYIKRMLRKGMQLILTGKVERRFGVGGVGSGRIQEFIQDLLEQEVTEWLGRVRCERQAAVDGIQGPQERLRQAS
ncbi:MAG: hypothetical protein QN198_08425 [Armatimonadota bacterium]|nr:hypothetical protein [Armatimonadota bacterium]